MKKVATILLLISLPIAVAALILIPGQIRSKHEASLVVTWNSLKVASVEIQEDGKFTNRYPLICHISEYTNRHLVNGTIYQCILAADSWDYRGRSNLLAITTNGMFLFIDRQGVRHLKTWNQLPEY